jgi:calcium/proton exchanger cax
VKHPDPAYVPGSAGTTAQVWFRTLGASVPPVSFEKHHTQEYNRVSARFQAGLLFLATIGLLVPSAVAEADSKTGAAFTNKLSVGLAVLLIAAYGLGMLFSLKTHRELRVR